MMISMYLGIWLTENYSFSAVFDDDLELEALLAEFVPLGILLCEEVTLHDILDLAGVHVCRVSVATSLCNHLAELVAFCFVLCLQT